MLDALGSWKEATDGIDKILSSQLLEKWIYCAT